MFLPVNFDSMNKVADLSPGLYACTCRAYQSHTDALKALVFKYSINPNKSALACDLMIIDALENVYFRDFMLMPDRTWRDSYGARGESLEALLPSEIFKYQLVEQYELEAQKVGV